MKKNMILWMSALVLTIAGLSSCSSDDDFSSNDLIGAWEMVRATYGMGGAQEFLPGEVVIIFDGKQLIVQNNNGAHFLKSGKYPYTTITEQSRIMTYEWVDVVNQVIVIHLSDEEGGNWENKYTYRFYDGMLVLDGGIATDGPGYFFRKYSPTSVPYAEAGKINNYFSFLKK